jgi:hypothetical protein
MKFLCNIRIKLQNFVTIILFAILLFTSTALSQLTCYTGGTSGSREDSDAVHNSQNGYIKSEFNYIDHNDGTADFELTRFTFWSLVRQNTIRGN